MAGMTWRRAAPSDVAVVFRGLGERSRLEIEAAGLTPQDAMAYVLDTLRANGGDAALVGDDVLGVIVWAESQPGELQTSFIATDAFFAQGRETIDFSRRYFASLQEWCFGLAIVCVCRLQGEKVRQWFEAIGFKGEARPDGTTAFRLEVRGA